MAEVTGLRNNALPYPIYGAPWGVVFPILDADGDLVTGATTPDAEVSKNGDTFADCTNESTEIATSSGVYYLLLTATEMTADVVAVIAKSATAGAKTTTLTFYPRKLVTIRSGTSASGGVSTSTIVLDASASAVDDFYNGMVCIATIDSNVEVRVITDYTGSTQTATVSPDWNVAPDNNDTFVIKLTEGVQINQANATAWLGSALAAVTTAGVPEVDITHIAGSAVSTSTAQLGVNVVNAAGTAWGSGAITAAAIATGAIDADAIADNAIDAGAIATGAITAAKFAAGAIDAAALAADAGTEIGTAVWATTTRALTILDEDSTTLDLDATIRAAVGLAAADLDTQLAALPTAAENADAVWDEDATGHQTGGTFGQAIGDPGADTTTIYQSVVTDAAGTNVAADIIAIKAQTAAIETDTAEIGVAGAGLTNINLPNQTMDIVGNITGNLSGSVGSVTGAVGSVTGAVGSVTGLTASDVAAIKAKTDSLTFTVANQVDANIQYVNDVAVTGTGAAGDEWGP